MSTVTYMPGIKSYIAGHHDTLLPNAQLLATVSMEGGNYAPIPGNSSEYQYVPLKTSTHIRNSSLSAMATRLHGHKDNILTQQLTAATFQGSDYDNIQNLLYIKLYNEILGKQAQWFHLDNMFVTHQVNKLQYDYSFQDSNAAAQDVPMREQFDTSKVKYDQAHVRMGKTVTSYDIPDEILLMAMLNPETPLQQQNEYARAYKRELNAYNALKALKYYYKKNANTGKWFDSTSSVTNDNTNRISNPSQIGANATHSTYNVANELQEMKNRFMTTQDVILNYGACNSKTAMAIAGNTWTKSNTIFNVEAFRTSGGVRPFPGLSDTTMVVSEVLPDNTIYFTNKQSNILIQAEGPKKFNSWYDNSRWTNQSAMADYYQYKCCQEDFTSITRKFGCIVELSTAA